MIQANLSTNYAPNDGEVNNIVYLCCKYACGWNMRGADLAVIQTLFKIPDKKPLTTGVEGIQRLVEITCEYLWDHIMGEPDAPTTEDLVKHTSEILTEWYANTTREQRDSIE